VHKNSCFRLGLHFKDDDFHPGQAEFLAGPPALFAVKDSKPISREADLDGFNLSFSSNAVRQLLDGLFGAKASLIGFDRFYPDPFDFHGKALSSFFS
jgi:hypothetical protein